MARLQLALRERRRDERRELTGLLPGKLKHAEREVSCRPIDVSQNGLGILTKAELEPGVQLTLELGTQKIPLQVAWIRQDFGKQDLFRYGLVAVNPLDNIEQVFLTAGCLR